jgi:hypothetical protein
MHIDAGTVIFVGVLSGVSASIGALLALRSTAYADRPAAVMKRARRIAVGFVWAVAVLWVVVVLLVTR